MTAAIADDELVDQGVTNEPLPLDDEYLPAPELDLDPEDAPYGTTKTGTARRKPGPRKTAPPRPAAKAAPKKTTGTRRSSSTSSARKTAPAATVLPPTLTEGAPTREVYQRGIAGWLQLPQMALAGAGLMRNNRALLADAAVVGIIARPFTELAADLAVKHQGTRTVDILDKVIIAGPYAALMTAFVGGAAQIACNHGWMAHDSLAGVVLGAINPDQLADQMIDDLQGAAAARGVSVP